MKRIKNLMLVLSIAILAIAGYSCGNKSYDQMTPEQQQKEYAKFQKDSLEICTKDARLAKAAVEGAFDRIPENNGYWKKDNVNVVYDNELNCWVGTVEYHYDRNNTYFQNQKVIYVHVWYEDNGLAKDGKIYYSTELAK